MQEWKIKTCPVCGCDFLPAAQHSYKIKRGSREEVVCTYSCQRKWEKSEPGKRKRKKQTQIKGIAVRVIETGEVFESVAACAAHFNCSRTSIYKCLKGNTYNDYHMEKAVNV